MLSSSRRKTIIFKVVVVPDNAAAKKVPEIPGLLEYRKDQKKLYVRANKTWNLLTQEKEVYWSNPKTALAAFGI